MLDRLARTMYRRRRLVVVGWIVFLVAVFTLSGSVGGAFKTNFGLPSSESQAAFDRLEERGFRDRAGESAQIVFEAPAGVDAPPVRRAMTELFADIERTVRDSSVVSPYSAQGARQIAADGSVAYAELNLADRTQEEVQAAGDDVEALLAAADLPAGVDVALGGDMFVEESPGGASEAVGVLAAMVILLIAFGSVLAMGLPIFTALCGVGSGIALVLMMRNVINMPDFTTAAVAMVGIGVGIDYALFIVTRYRERLHGGHTPEDSIAHSIDTAGRAVLFAGCTVMISVLGLLLMNLDTTRGVAIAIALGVLMTMLAAITLLPALLGFVGTNIDRLGLPHRTRRDQTGHGSFWYRWSRVLQRRPWIAALAGLVVLLALSVPVLSMRLGFGDAGNRPTSDTTRQAYDRLSDGFGPGFNGPLLLVAATPGGANDTGTLDRLDAALSETPGVAFTAAPITNDAGDTAVIQVFPATAPQDAATEDLVDRLRDDVVPAVTAGTDVEVSVGGLTAAAVDFAEYTANQLPVFMGAVLLLSFLLLMVVFRSLLVPLKAVVMNLLSIGAAYGVVVAVYQWGWAGDLFGIGRPGPIEAWAPVFLFAVVFGLSMDYEVFLLSRIREEYDRTGDNASAVADGVALTARVITAAAAIMVCVFGSFVFGPERSLQLFGLGLAVAVLIDATVVRLVLVPATMELLGDGNWWFPRWLDRVLPRVHLEGRTSLDDELTELTKDRTPAVTR
jgi:RND superfamily putative drug exporter